LFAFGTGAASRAGARSTAATSEARRGITELRERVRVLWPFAPRTGS
jgi:hypothetical protein